MKYPRKPAARAGGFAAQLPTEAQLRDNAAKRATNYRAQLTAYRIADLTAQRAPYDAAQYATYMPTDR